LEDDDFGNDDDSLGLDPETDDLRKWDVFLPDDEIDQPDDGDYWQDEEDE
jgi:hypothetical protein